MQTLSEKRIGFKSHIGLDWVDGRGRHQKHRYRRKHFALSYTRVDEYEIFPCLSATLFNAPAGDYCRLKWADFPEKDKQRRKEPVLEVGPLTIQVEKKTTNYGERAERHEQRSCTAKSPL